MHISKCKSIINPCFAELIKMLCPLLIFSQSDYLIQVVDTNSHTLWQTMQIQISWLLQDPSDLGLCCLQMQGISMFSRTRVNSLGANNKIVANDILKHFQITFFGEDICISSRMAASHKGNNLLPKETNYFLKRVCQFRTDTSTRDFSRLFLGVCKNNSVLVMPLKHMGQGQQKFVCANIYCSYLPSHQGLYIQILHSITSNDFSSRQWRSWSDNKDLAFFCPCISAGMFLLNVAHIICFCYMISK